MKQSHEEKIWPSYEEIARDYPVLEDLYSYALSKRMDTRLPERLADIRVALNSMRCYVLDGCEDNPLKPYRTPDEIFNLLALYEKHP